MFRLATSLAVLLAAMGAPVLAADWGESWGDNSFRPGFEPKDWSGLGDTDDGITIETGLRYWYSIGTQSFEATGQNFESSDTAHTGELHLRIDDHVSRTYAKGIAGYSAVIHGTFSDGNYTDAEISDGHIGYVGGDFGWNTLGDGDGNGAGIFAGYQYWNDSPRTSRADFTSAASVDDVSYDPDTGEVFLPWDSKDNNLDIHMLRLGISGKTKVGETFDLSGEVAAVPYAKIDGVLGGSGFSPDMLTPLGNYSFVKSSETTVDGWGYGAMGEVMLGITPIENLTFRVGGRAWYLQGTADNTYTAMTLTDPSDSDAGADPNFDTPPVVTNQSYIETANPFSLFRYGLLAEMTYAF